MRSLGHKPILATVARPAGVLPLPVGDVARKAPEAADPAPGAPGRC